MSRSGAFTGYSGTAARTAVPNAFFAELLPRLAARPAELVIATYAFFAIGRRRGSPRYVTTSDLRADEPLRAALAGALRVPPSDREAIDRTLDAALDALVDIGALLRIDSEDAAAYFLPTPADRRAMARLRAQRPTPRRAPEGSAAPADRAAGRPSDIVALYEDNIGTVPPLLIDELREAEDLYPPEWIEDAFRRAMTRNVRHWNYVRAILESWAERGRDEDAQTERDSFEQQRDRYLGGRWRDLVR